MNTKLGTCFILMGFSITCIAGAEWSYEGNNGPEFWENHYPACGLNAQSPINIPLFSELEEDTDLGQFTFHGYDNDTVVLTLTNNGHTAQVNIEGTSVWIEGGGLTGKYIAAQFHFHWGSNDSVGSEHLLHGRQYPIELHIVHYKESYGSLGNAVDKPNGLAVVGIFGVTMTDDNQMFSELTDNLHQVKDKDAEYTLNGVSMNNFVPTYHDRFYRYQGSLTTPECQESVTWSVLTDRLKMSKAQLEKFRELYTTSSTDTDAKHIVDNFRPVQDLNGRAVKINFTSNGVSLNNMSVLNILIACLVVINQVL